MSKTHLNSSSDLTDREALPAEQVPHPIHGIECVTWRLEELPSLGRPLESSPPALKAHLELMWSLYGIRAKQEAEQTGHGGTSGLPYPGR